MRSREVGPLPRATQLVKTRTRHEVRAPWGDKEKETNLCTDSTDSPQRCTWGGRRDIRTPTPTSTPLPRRPCLSRNPPERSHPAAGSRLCVFSDVASRGHQHYCTASTVEWLPWFWIRSLGPLGHRAQTSTHSHIQMGCTGCGTPDGRATCPAFWTHRRMHR